MEDDIDESRNLDYIDNTTLNSYKGLQIIQYNVRSLFHKIDIVRYDFLTPSMDILCFTETWLNESLPDEMISIDNFQLLRNDRSYGRGGGTCIFIKNHIQFENNLNYVNERDVEIQGVHIGGTGLQPQKQIVLVVVYRPPRGNSLNACSKIKSYIQNIENIHKKEIVLVGDFNWNVSVDRSIGLDCVDEISTDLGLEQMIKCSTRIGKNSESTIDLVFTNIINIFGVGCLIGSFSDHLPTYLIKKRVKLPIELIEVRKRKMSNYCKESLSNKLNMLDWSLIDLLQDVNEIWEMIRKAIVYELDNMCPYGYIKIRKNIPTWFSKDLISLARERDNLFKHYKRGGKKNQDLFSAAVKKR